VLLHSELNRYRSPHVRNLAWALLSPALIETRNTKYHLPHSIYEQAYHDIQPHLSTIDNDDQTLSEYLQLNNHYRLGIYFERCWLYWLQHSKQFRLLSSNLPVRDDKKTLGEFDLIVKNQTSGDVEHWELAIKFYLQVNPPGRDTQWLGPNLKDRLSRKYHHLIDQQLALSDNPVAKQLCLDRGWDIVTKRLLSKGRLFYAFNEQLERPPAACPDYIQEDHQTGWWLSESEFERTFSPLPQCQFHRLEKREWMAQSGCEALSYRQFVLQLQRDTLEHPVQVLVSRWTEKPEILFLVPDQWHSQALSVASIGN